MATQYQSCSTSELLRYFFNGDNFFNSPTVTLVPSRLVKCKRRKKTWEGLEEYSKIGIGLVGKGYEKLVGRKVKIRIGLDRIVELDKVEGKTASTNPIVG